MGARTNYVIKTTKNPEQDIVVYSHWDGEESVQIFSKALKHSTTRLGDNSYFTRMLIDQLTKGGRDGELGYGVYVGKVTHEESYDYKEVDLVNNTVTIGDSKISLEEFINDKSALYI